MCRDVNSNQIWHLAIKLTTVHDWLSSKYGKKYIKSLIFETQHLEFCNCLTFCCCSYHLESHLLVSGRCLWLLRASTHSPPLVHPTLLHTLLCLPPQSQLPSPPPPLQAPISTPPHFASPCRQPECSAFETPRSLPLQFLGWVNPVTVHTNPAAHPKTRRTRSWDPRRGKTIPVPLPFLLTHYWLWTITRGMAAVITQHYKVQEGQQQPQPKKGDLGMGGFGAVERTGCQNLKGLKGTIHRTGG